MNEQIFVSQPSDKHRGMYEIAKFSEKDDNYIPLRGEIYFTEDEAKQRAHELNEQYKKMKSS